MEDASEQAIGTSWRGGEGDIIEGWARRLKCPPCETNRGVCLILEGRQGS